MNTSRKQAMLSRVRALFKGKREDIPARLSGADLREALGAPQDRQMIVRPASGGMARNISDSEVLQVQEGDEFDDLPLGYWG